MKKILLATALLLLITGCCGGVLLFKTNRQQRFKGNRITHHFFVSGIGQKKTVDAAICGGAENVLKRNSQHFVNGLLGFITLAGIYTPLEARVYCSQ